MRNGTVLEGAVQRGGQCKPGKHISTAAATTTTTTTTTTTAAACSASISDSTANGPTFHSVRARAVPISTSPCIAPAVGVAAGLSGGIGGERRGRHDASQRVAIGAAVGAGHASCGGYRARLRTARVCATAISPGVAAHGQEDRQVGHIVGQIPLGGADAAGIVPVAARAEVGGPVPMARRPVNRDADGRRAELVNRSPCGQLPDLKLPPIPAVQDDMKVLPLSSGRTRQVPTRKSNPQRTNEAGPN